MRVGNAVALALTAALAVAAIRCGYVVVPTSLGRSTARARDARARTRDPMWTWACADTLPSTFSHVNVHMCSCPSQAAARLRRSGSMSGVTAALAPRNAAAIMADLRAAELRRAKIRVAVADADARAAALRALLTNMDRGVSLQQHDDVGAASVKAHDDSHVNLPFSQLQPDQDEEWLPLPLAALGGLGLGKLGDTVDEFRAFFGDPMTAEETSIESLLSPEDFVPDESGYRHVLPDGRTTRLRMRKVQGAFTLEWLM